MAKGRSPNYPSIGLGDALEAARTLYTKERRTAVSPEVAVKAWGYQSLSGLARTKLAALKKYGLIENEGHGIRISDRALTLIQYGPETAEYREALSQAAMSPEIFAELALTHAEASDDALRAFLVTKKGFSEAGALTFIQSFRDTLSLAGSAGSGYTSSMRTETQPQSAPPLAPPGALGAKQGRPLSMPLDEEGTTAEVRIIGPNGALVGLSVEHADALMEYLGIVRKRLERKQGDA
jgi:hypothetical protein